jgi:hypothetical protein
MGLGFVLRVGFDGIGGIIGLFVGVEGIDPDKLTSGALVVA